MTVVDMLSQSMELPAGKLTGTERLSEIEAWDSLALLSFMALVDSKCGITLSPDTLLRCEAIRDLEALILDSAKPVQ